MSPGPDLQVGGPEEPLLIFLGAEWFLGRNGHLWASGVPKGTRKPERDPKGEAAPRSGARLAGPSPGEAQMPRSRRL
jgi:hypothetical protein